MTTHSCLHVPTGISTQMHIAMPQQNCNRPRTDARSFGIAAVLFSAIGVDLTRDLAQEDRTTTGSLQERR